jgi:hypothetical protein
MQIPKIPFPLGPGFLRQTQPGSSENQVNAPDAARPAKPATERAGATGLSTANTLDEAVRALRAAGRLPARGSLVDLSA